MCAYDAGPISVNSQFPKATITTYHKLCIHQRLSIRNPRPPRLPNIRMPLRPEDQTLDALQARRILIIRQYPAVNRLDILLHIIRLVRRTNTNRQHDRANRTNIPRRERMCRELREGLVRARGAAALTTPR
jgi:hypothetical protein